MLQAMSKLFAGTVGRWKRSVQREHSERPPRPSRMQFPVLRARYDAAQTTPDNMRHWAAADSLSANSANSPMVRATLRNRARYETNNNSYAKGMILTLANDTIGTGPRLQLRGDAKDAQALAAIEREFMAWVEEIRLAERLRTLRMAKATDGEAFLLPIFNDRLLSRVKLDVRLVEAEMVATPYTELMSSTSAVDGIEFDASGTPTYYHVLRQHPGDIGFVLGEYDRIPAHQMMHYFRVDRPGQCRGIPEITAALPLFAQLRRYTLAVIAAAETAADFAAVIYTDAPPDGGSAELEPLDPVKLEKRMATTLPAGWKLGQLDAAQPTTTYREFKAEILNEIARCLNMPFNVAACNSSSYNYASGRLDHQTYFRSIQVEQAHIERTILEPLFGMWLQEARLIPGFLSEIPILLAPTWIWDGREHVDPAKEANAQATRLKSLTTTLATEYARVGKDWEAELRQRAREKALIRELHLEDEPVQKSGDGVPPPPEPPAEGHSPGGFPSENFRLQNERRTER